MSDHVIDSLSDYVDDELSANQRAVVDTHLRACNTCGALLDDLRTIVAHARLAATTDRAPSRDLWKGILARIRGREPSTFAAASDRMCLPR